MRAQGLPKWPLLHMAPVLHETAEAFCTGLLTGKGTWCTKYPD